MSDDFEDSLSGLDFVVDMMKKPSREQLEKAILDLETKVRTRDTHIVHLEEELVALDSDNTRLTLELDSTLDERDELREELAEAHLSCAALACGVNLMRKRMDAAEQRNAELIELLAEHQWQWKPLDDHYHTPPGYYCIQCGNSRSSGHAPECAIALALKGEDNE